MVLSCPAAYGILIPQLGIELAFPALQVGFFEKEHIWVSSNEVNEPRAYYTE